MTLRAASAMLAQRRLPVGAVGADRDLADHGIGHAVQEVVLVAHVRVEGHRLDAQLLRELAHADGLDAVAVGELDGGRHHPLPGQLGAAFRARGAQRGELHVTSPRPRSRLVSPKRPPLTSLHCKAYPYVVRIDPYVVRMSLAYHSHRRTRKGKPWRPARQPAGRASAPLRRADSDQDAGAASRRAPHGRRSTTVPASPLTMRAVIQDGYGAPERVLRLEEIPVPPVGADDVLVRMRATSVNTPDWATVTGVPVHRPPGHRAAPAEAPGPRQRRRGRGGGRWRAGHRPGARR